MNAENRVAAIRTKSEKNALPHQRQPEEERLSMRQRIRFWVVEDALSWWISVMVHTVIFLAVGLLMGRDVVRRMTGDAPVFRMENQSQSEEPEIERIEIGDAPLDPTELSPETIDLNEPPDAGQLAQEARYYDDNPVFEEQGGGLVTGSELGAGGLGFDIKASGLGPMLEGGGGAEAGKGTGIGWGAGGSASGFGGRGQGHREALLGRYGGTKQTERAVAGALNWLARHQNSDGSWSVSHGGRRTCDCGGFGFNESICAATALGVLPFLGSGITHQTQTRNRQGTTANYRVVVEKALRWLTKQQKPTGDLSDVEHQEHQMYAHCLATIALCEAFGMTNDYSLKEHALSAVRFVETSQNGNGGWRYRYRTPDSDTSVFGWAMMALKSGQMAGLEVDHARLKAGQTWLDIASVRGNSLDERGRFSYREDGPPTPSMTAIGLLITQYLGARAQDPTIVGGVQYLMDNPPNLDERNTYYWYYATQVLHHLADSNWDTWNRSVRRILVESQVTSGCASGSWSPAVPTKDVWGPQGGRLMLTSLSALTLEVYYRHLPLYQLDNPAKDRNPATVPESDEPGS